MKALFKAASKRNTEILNSYECFVMTDTAVSYFIFSAKSMSKRKNINNLVLFNYSDKQRFIEGTSNAQKLLKRLGDNTFSYTYHK